MDFKKFKRLSLKFLWLIIFKFKYHKSPKTIITSYEHRGLKKYVKNPNLIIDIGFNKGQFSSLALEYWPKVPLIAFDPHPFACKKASTKLKNSYKNFEFRNKGISRTHKNYLKLNLADKSDNSSFLYPTNLNNKLFKETKIKGEYLTKVNTIENEINPKKFKSNWLIKIDVQGSEMDVLESFSEEQYNKIKWIYMEVTDLLLYKKQASSKKLKEFLESKDFKLIESFNSNYLDGKLIYADFLFEK